MDTNGNDEETPVNGCSRDEFKAAAGASLNDDIFKSAIDDTNALLKVKDSSMSILSDNSPSPGSEKTDVSQLTPDDSVNMMADCILLSDSKLDSSPQVPAKKMESHGEDNGLEERDKFIDVSITEASKVGEGMSAYVSYKIETRTNLGLFRRKSFSVNRRFSDFLGLHDKLVEKYLRSGRIIPPAPEKDALGTTRLKMSSSQVEQSVGATEFIERRRASLQRYLHHTLAHPVLKVDPDVREFLEADGELPKATNTSALSGAGVKRLFSKFGETVNKITYKMDESEPWFEEKSILLDNVDVQLRKLHSNAEQLVVNRKELAVATGAFAKAAAMLSNCEEHTGLSRALSQLAETEEKVENVRNEQANSDFMILCEMLKDYIALIGAVKEVFHERVKVYQIWQHSQMMLVKKREQKVRMECSGNKSDKYDQACNEVVEWEAKVERCEDEFRKMSKVIKCEFESFEKDRIKNMKAIIITYLEALIQHQMHLVKHWEGFLPEAKAIV